MRKGKRRYLYKITTVVMLALFLPIVCIFVCFWNQSFEEIQKSNDEYYGARIETFENRMIDKIMELKKHATSIVVGSKNPQSAFWKGSEKFRENKYWYYEAQCELIEEYTDDKLPEFGIYYYETDHIIATYGTLKSENLLQRKVREDSPKDMRTFFDAGRYLAGEMIFATANGEEDYEGEMLVGYCTTLGMSQEPVLIYYVIQPDTYEDSMNFVYDNKDIHFYIVNEEEKQVYLALGEAAEERTNIFDIKREMRIGGTAYKVIYQEDTNYIPLSFLMYLTEDSLQNDIIEFYYHMKRLVIGTSMVFLMLCLVVLYVAYKPIYKLTSDIEYDGTDEFEGIKNVLNDNQLKISEQEMLILDLILKHLIYGVSISTDMVSRLGISPSLQYYCVFAMEGPMLLSNEVNLIIDEIEKKCAVRLFITDWQEKKMNIFIVFLKSVHIEKVEKEMSVWLERHSPDKHQLYVGNVVHNLNEIRSSLMSCLKKQEERNGGGTAGHQSLGEIVKTLGVKDDKLKKMKEEILAYLEIHYRDTELSQSSVADYFQISNYTLSRMFKSQVGCGFTEYVNSKRLEYAKELLLTTSYSVREISVMAGFENDNYFSRIFKATIGVTATKFREG